jgi:hypothetical protein
VDISGPHNHHQYNHPTFAPFTSIYRQASNERCRITTHSAKNIRLVVSNSGSRDRDEARKRGLSVRHPTIRNNTA